MDLLFKYEAQCSKPWKPHGSQVGCGLLGIPTSEGQEQRLLRARQPAKAATLVSAGFDGETLTQ